MNSETQRNMYGFLGLLSFGAGIVTGMNGDIEIAMLCSALAPTCIAMRSGIWSNNQERHLDDEVRNIYESMELDRRHNEEQYNEVFRNINQIIDDMG